MYNVGIYKRHTCTENLATAVRVGVKRDTLLQPIPVEGLGVAIIELLYFVN